MDTKLKEAVGRVRGYMQARGQSSLLDRNEIHTIYSNGWPALNMDDLRALVDGVEQRSKDADNWAGACAGAEDERDLARAALDRARTAIKVGMPEYSLDDVAEIIEAGLGGQAESGKPFTWADHVAVFNGKYNQVRDEAAELIAGQRKALDAWNDTRTQILEALCAPSLRVTPVVAVKTWQERAEESGADALTVDQCMKLAETEIADLRAALAQVRQ
jgi:hypothetical protein